MIGIINYGMGNVFSVSKAVEHIGYNTKICNFPEDLESVDKIILPGVGAFEDCIKKLKNTGFIDELNELVLHKGIPIYGICLGMQVMAKKSYEFGEHDGLGWFDGSIVPIKPKDKRLKIPHVGWNEVSFKKQSPLFDCFESNPKMYFVHSYQVKLEDDNNLDAYCYYESRITAAIRKKNIFGTQFHPEKSQDMGLKVLENFIKWNP